MNDGAEGPDAATTAAPPYDLIVTDNYMLHLNGAELVAELRRRFPTQSILHLDDRSLPHDADPPADVPNLYKLFSIDGLLASVEKVLAGRQREG